MSTRNPLINDPNIPSWHPKITPYRFSMLLTTISLGTAKAVLTQRGTTIAPITLEWFAGTLVFLLFFSVSAYDYTDDVPSNLSWLFRPDCMDIVWRLLEYFDIPRPRYLSEEGRSFNTHGGRPAITPYRVLVCAMAVSLGFSKATLGYYDQSTAVTWVDWALAVPITTFLYVLGLYEYNSLNSWTYFFVADQSEVFHSINLGIKYTFGIAISSAWTSYFSYILWYSSTSPSWDFETVRPQNQKVAIKTWIEDGCDSALKLFLQQSVRLAIVAGAAALFSVFRLIARDVTGRNGLVRRMSHTLRRAVGSWAGVVSSSSSIDDLSTRRPSRLVNFIGKLPKLSHLVIHTSVHLFLITGCLVWAMLSLGLSVQMLDLGKTKGGDFIMVTGFYITSIFCFCSVFGCLLGTARLVYSLLAPFWYWWLESRPFSEKLIIL